MIDNRGILLKPLEARDAPLMPGVLEAYRRQGIVTGMLQDLRTLAIARDCASVYVQADQEALAATALYTSMGEASDVVHFDLFIRPSD